MQGVSLTDLVTAQLEEARTASSGRSSTTVHGGREHELRQTVIALAAGRTLDEHDSPPEATVLVLYGRVRLTTLDDAWEGAASDFLIIPADRHALEALEDAAVLLTVANKL